MRCLTLLVVLFVLLSCQRKGAEGDGPDFVYSVDTVMIDPGDEILFLRYRLVGADISSDGKYLLNFNLDDHTIEEINLDELRLEEKLPFETEGPDGTGKHVNFINVLKSDSIFIKSFGQSALFQKDGGLVKRADWRNAIDEEGLRYGEIPQNELAIDSGDLKVFGLNYDNKKKEVFLDVLSLAENRVKRYDIDAEKSYQNFVLAPDNPQSYTFLDPLVFLNAENDFVLVSHQFSNEIHLFNSEGELIQTVHYEPKMTPKRARDLSGKNILSYEQIKDEYQSLVEQVKFGPPVWDRVNKRYLRLSKSVDFLESHKDEHSFLPEIKEIRVYLSVFDSEFNLISELAIPELNTEFVKYFAKDGKLWVSQNYSDELGFIVVNF
ncbi:MAG: DUF4221 family protein [Cyclobacteriaceae bacterium]